MSEWKLKKFTIELKEYGTNAGKYEAEVQFKNGSKDSFTTTLSGTQTQAFLDLIANRVVTISEEMSERLAESLGVDRTKPDEDINSFFTSMGNKNA